MNPQLSIVTTCHPNSDVMEAFISAIDYFASQRKLSTELIIVNNFLSNDAASLFFEFGSFVTAKILVSEREKGQTGSMIQGLMHARSDQVLSIDPDMVSSLDAVDKMLTLLNKGFVVVLARRKLHHRVGWRAISSYVFNVLMSFALGFRVHDLNSPMFLVRKSVINSLSVLSLPMEAYKLRLFMDYRQNLIEMPVRDISSRLGISSTYHFSALLALFFKRLWLAIRLRVKSI